MKAKDIIPLLEKLGPDAKIVVEQDDPYDYPSSYFSYPEVYVKTKTALDKNGIPQIQEELVVFDVSTG